MNRFRAAISLAPPGPAARLADRLLARWLALPPANGYRVAHRLALPRRDGGRLSAAWFEPDTAPPGTVLALTPYGREEAALALPGGVLAGQGLRVLVVRARGTDGSGEPFTPFRHDADDLEDAYRWLRKILGESHPVALFGASYGGFAALALAAQRPEEIAAAAVIAAPHDLYRALWGAGHFALEGWITWSDVAARLHEPWPLRLWHFATLPRRLARTLRRRTTPEEAARSLLGTRPNPCAEWSRRPAAADPYWRPLRLGALLRAVRCPTLVAGGLADPFAAQFLDQYRTLSGRRAAALTLGPWRHWQLLGRGAAPLARETVAWLAAHLAGAGAPRHAPVHLHVRGSNRPRWLTEWPPPAEVQTWYPRADGTLGDSPDAGWLRFTCDPRDPTPSAAPWLLAPGGKAGDEPLLGRADLLCFTSPPLTAPRLVAGRPRAVLHHGADRPGAVRVRLSAVDSRGRSRLLAEGYRARRAGAARLTLPLDPLAVRLPAGTRLRLWVAGASFPRCIPPDGETPSEHRLALPGCRLLLPVVAADSEKS
ncbi:MAG: hydrolase [Porticoccaceae bacterium]|nr:MAG: hydrolase [Porticoccaceae bacterium]